MPSPIEITFLGTGAAVPNPDRKHACIVLQREGDSFLFDCGEGAQIALQVASISPMKISRIFITHWHADHFAGLLPLLETLHLLRREEPLYIYGPEAQRFVDALLELSYWGVGFELKVQDVPTNKPMEIFKTDEYSIWSIPTKHNVPSCGYMLKENPHWKIDLKRAKKFGLAAGPKLQQIKEKGGIEGGGKMIGLKDIAVQTPGRSVVYSGDTLAHEPLFKFIRGTNLLIHDGTYIEAPEGRSHAEVSETAALAKRYDIQKLVLTHISRRYKNVEDIAREARKVFKNSSVAKDGMKIRL